MSKYIKYGVYGLIGLALAFWVFRACKLDDRYSKLKGQYETLEKLAIQELEKSEAVIADQARKIKHLDKAIEGLNDKISETSKESEVKSEEIKKLEAVYPTLVDKDAKIANLEQQVALWSSRFSLAERTITDKDKIIFSLTGKFDAQVKIAEEYKAQLDREVYLRSLAEKQTGMCESRLRIAKLGGNIKTVAIAVLGGLVVYKLLK